MLREPGARPSVARVEGMLLGGAIGDALGRTTEFLPHGEIVRRFGADGPAELIGNPALITDDTQMTLAVGDALLETLTLLPGEPVTPERIEPVLRRHLIAWFRDPENNRAPGNTCLTACGRLEDGLPWTQATVHGSKGCGANMRVAPVAVLASLRTEIAQLQAGMTHGHPTALAAADLTAEAYAFLLGGMPPSELLEHLLAVADERRDTYHAAWLGALWQRPGERSAEAFIRRGWDECRAVLQRLRDGLPRLRPGMDPCDLTGEGWIAEEALATALLCFLATPDDPVAVVRRAATTAGDSDSLASIAGSLAGAHLGAAAWPDDWRRRVEHAARLSAMARDLVARADPQSAPGDDIV